MFAPDLFSPGFATSLICTAFRVVVENLVAAADAQGNIRFDFHLKEGQTVKVMAGPFAELVGQLERLDDNGRVRVVLEIWGGKIRVALPQKLVAPAQDVA